MTEEQLLEMRTDLDEQYKKDRDTLDRMIELVRRKNDASGHSRPPEDPTANMLIKDRIEHYILQIAGNFTMQEARKFIAEKAPTFAGRLREDAMSAALYKMKKDGKIKVIIPKKGIVGAIYAKS